METQSHFLELEAPLAVTGDQVDFFKKNGFIKLKNVLSAECLHYYENEITTKVFELNGKDQPVDEPDAYGNAFLQVINIWRHSEAVKLLVMSKRLGGIACQLLETTGVRLYHDQALYKEPGGVLTPWHADQMYWPLAGEKAVTAWIPLQAVSLEMGPLAFSPASQNLTTGRDMKISDDSLKRIEKMLSDSQYGCEESIFDLGEVSFHYGWTYHRAGPNTSDQTRKVLTIVYMDKQMRLKQPENPNQQSDWEKQCPGAEIGEIIDTPQNPVICDNAEGMSPQ
jgi:ectoine hydroxylase-related dioxygenase (phytanoyl-CoA dioxygenase family)